MPRVFHSNLFEIGLESQFGCYTMIGDHSKQSSFIDDYECISLGFNESISYSFKLLSMFSVEANVLHSLSISLSASCSDSNEPDVEIGYTSNQVVTSIILKDKQPEEDGESELICPLPDFLAKRFAFRAHGW